MRERGLSDEELEDRLYWDSLTFDVVKQWRVGALPDHAGLRRAGHGAHRGHLPVLGLEVKKRPVLLIVIALNLARAGGAGLRLSRT